MYPYKYLTFLKRLIMSCSHTRVLVVALLTYQDDSGEDWSYSQKLRSPFLIREGIRDHLTGLLLLFAGVPNENSTPLHFFNRTLLFSREDWREEFISLSFSPINSRSTSFFSDSLEHETTRYSSSQVPFKADLAQSHRSSWVEARRAPRPSPATRRISCWSSLPSQQWPRFFFQSRLLTTQEYEGTPYAIGEESSEK